MHSISLKVTVQGSPYAFISYDGGFLTSCPSPRLEDHLFRLSVTAYSINLQLPSISGGSLFHPQLSTDRSLPLCHAIIFCSSGWFQIDSVVLQCYEMYELTDHQTQARRHTYTRSMFYLRAPPLWSSGQSSWLQIQRSWFNSRRYQIFWEVADLERGPLSLVRIIEELFQGNSGSDLENRN
jgi:hypothetical protein